MNFSTSKSNKSLNLGIAFLDKIIWTVHRGLYIGSAVGNLPNMSKPGFARLPSSRRIDMWAWEGSCAIYRGETSQAGSQKMF